MLEKQVFVSIRFLIPLRFIWNDSLIIFCWGDEAAIRILRIAASSPLLFLERICHSERSEESDLKSIEPLLTNNIKKSILWQNKNLNISK
jgi:hypothetical protein